MSGMSAAKLAQFDQTSAFCNELLDQMVATVREELDSGTDPAAVTMTALISMSVDPGRAATLAAYALVRLARQEPGR